MADTASDDTPSGPLPPLYARWMGELLPGPLPVERYATCGDCAMCATPELGQTAQLAFYSPRTKCCTYLPNVWNFLAGRLLEDDDPAAARGRATVEARIEAGAGVTPLGLGKTPAYILLYGSIEQAWGKSMSMRCPHYLEAEGGLCGIWKHRESTCATWFCKHERGAVGRDFWLAIHQLLQVAERGVALWCVRELDIGVDALRALFPHEAERRTMKMSAAEFDGRADPERYRGVWGRWLGRERDFYRQTAGLVAGMRWSDVTRICGPDLDLFSQVARSAWDRLGSDTVPARLRVGKYEVLDTGAEHVTVTGYSGLDPLRLPRHLVAVLGYFDGRPTEDALRAIAEREGLEVDPGLVAKLADFRILVSVEEGRPALLV